jgi:uncharacterized protein YjbI with pentapeptide repeats
VDRGSQPKKLLTKRWLLPLLLFLIGLTVWAPSFWYSGEEGGNYSDLGSAIAGGAIVALVVLFLERQFATEADRSNTQLQLALQKQATELQVGLWKDAQSIGLRYRDLRGIHWRSVDMSLADLTKADFEGSTVLECIMDGAFLWGTVFTKTDLRRTRFIGAKLGGAVCIQAVLRVADLYGADCGAGIHLNEEFKSTDFSRANLQRVNFTRANLTKVNLEEADLRGAVLKGANLQQASLNGANLAKADLQQADLRGINLQHVDLTDIKYDEFTRWPTGFVPNP